LTAGNDEEEDLKMPIGRLCRTICAAGLLGATLLLTGCNDKAVDKTGPAVAPDQMPQDKQKQYQDFMKQKGGGGGGGAPGGAAPPPRPPPETPGGAPAPPMPHG
jgi:hypothetical protein